MSKKPVIETTVKTVTSVHQNLIYDWKNVSIYGTVDTPAGIIAVYSQNWGTRPGGYTQLFLIMDGKCR